MKEKNGKRNPDRNVSECIGCGAKSPQKYGLWCDDCWNEMERAAQLEATNPAALLKPDRRETGRE